MKRALSLIVLFFLFPSNCEAQLTATEQLIKSDVVSRGGDWEGATAPRLVAFLGQDFVSSDLEYLRHLPTAEIVVVENVNLDSNGTAHIAAVVCLKTLRFAGCSFPIRSFNEFKLLRKLQELRISSAELSDEQFDDIAELKNLKYLVLEKVTLKGDALNSISRMQHLKQIDFIDCSVSDDAALKKAIHSVQQKGVKVVSTFKI